MILGDSQAAVASPLCLCPKCDIHKNISECLWGPFWNKNKKLVPDKIWKDIVSINN